MRPEALEETLTRVEAIPPAEALEFLRIADRGLQHYVIAHYIKKLLYDITFGLGPLSDLLRLPNITEIMVVNPTLVYVERAGKIIQTHATFFDEESTLSVIERIISPLGRRVDRSQPLVDARLPDGSRVNAAVPPVTPKWPCITIRRFPTLRITGQHLLERKSVSRAGLRLLRAFVLAKANILVAGGTGSGKTTLLNVLAGMVPVTERIVTIEDAAELSLPGKHVITMEAKPPNAEGAGAVTIRDLVKNALRMRPDRIIVGECRGGEALDMLQAMNTGHPGSLTTVHANRVSDVASRLETMVMMALEMPLSAIRRQIAQAVNVIVFVERQSAGSRLITDIAEVTGIHPASGEVETRSIMAVAPEEKNLLLRPTGYMPSFLEQLLAKGEFSLEDWFHEAEGAES